jgi:Zn-dependent protease
MLVLLVVHKRGVGRKSMVSHTQPSRAGLLVLAFKLGPKVVPMLMKVLKGLFGFKALGAVASVGLYSYLLTWEMGVALVAFLLTHEYGHLWAMKKCGLKTKGIYLIPGFGGVALAAEGFRSGRNEAFIAIMGPIFGLFFAIPLVALYMYTGNLLYIAIMSFALFINLLNLFPIAPLDGGRIVKALMYSIKQSWGFIFMIVSFVIAIALSAYFGLGLLLLIAAVGLMEMVTDYGLNETLDKFKKAVFRIIGGVALFLFGKSVYGSSVVDAYIRNIPNQTINEWSVIGFVFIIIAISFILALFARDIYKSTAGMIVTYPIVIVRDAFLGIIELLSLKHDDLKRVDGHVQMNRGQLKMYSLLYLFICVFHVVIIIYAAQLANFTLVTGLLE